MTEESVVLSAPNGFAPLDGRLMRLNFRRHHRGGDGCSDVPNDAMAATKRDVGPPVRTVTTVRRGPGHAEEVRRPVPLAGARDRRSRARRAADFQPAGLLIIKPGP